jgi:uncharacterized protein (DUF2126 family)
LPPLPPDFDPNRRPVQGQSAPWIIRTALCVEPRDGRLHVFMPPVATTEDYLDLIAGIETAVTEMGTPVIIEGETPPRDPRLNKLAVTPDPGVIEVNMHPSNRGMNWSKRTTVLYEEARLTRLGTEKFMLDGRHTGTGGGNHIIIGGDTPRIRRFAPARFAAFAAGLLAESSVVELAVQQFVHRPDRARRRALTRRATIRFTNSKSPSRNWIATRNRRFGYTPPWLVDRLFRNLLIDASGNTHRAEFSALINFSRPKAAAAGSAWSRCARLKCRRTRA